jgi:hypothetical protein
LNGPGSLYTVYVRTIIFSNFPQELRQGETGEGSEFHELDESMFYKMTKILEKTGKIQYFQKKPKPSDEDAIKFL